MLYLEDEEVFPFGSRTKGIEESLCNDYDYAVQYSDSVKNKLKHLGFEPCYDAGYEGANLTVAVYKKDNIDVVLKSDLQRFKKFWNKLSNDFYQDFIWKHSGIYSQVPEGTRSYLISKVVEELIKFTE